jgi:hypothetical protein
VIAELVRQHAAPQLLVDELAAQIGRDLLEEVAEKNVVRVTVHRARRDSEFGRVYRIAVFDELAEVCALLPALARQDELRMLAGEKPIFLDELNRRLGGELVDVVPNLRTNVGKDYVADSLGNSGSRPAVAEYIAVSADATAPAAGDTTLTGEISSGGLARATATYAHTVNTTSYTLTKTFTATATQNNVQKAGNFNASSGGTMFLENTFTSTSLVSNDQLTLTWTVNI